MQKFLEQNPALQKFLELNPVSQKFPERIYNSYQDFIAALNRSGVPDGALWMLKLCRRVLGGTPSTRTMVGEQQLREPFFNYGNLIMQGRLRSYICNFAIFKSVSWQSLWQGDRRSSIVVYAYLLLERSKLKVIFIIANITLASLELQIVSWMIWHLEVEIYWCHDTL
ncbi:uncharacterized protein FTOL_13760 [Fusarium torulosum]|uniref:Uncharacterized protein n=1 Tax=Fusarium torulosum TaxID=33205 RepID=A0AAE8MN30_9HYPO|nr:uncharacterized protein FTOL_13760 [Fusarium torulosum]